MSTDPAQGTATAPAPPAAIEKKRPMETLRDLLWQNKAYFARVLPRQMSADRLLQVTLAAAGRDEKLLDCTPVSILRALMISAQLGLDPSGILGQAYLVPFRNGKTGKTEAQFMVGYRGLIDLARRGGVVVHAEAHVVYERDEFRFVLGVEPELRHVPSLEDDRGQPRAAWAIVRLKDSPVPLMEVMPRARIEKARQTSAARDAAAWRLWWDEMARKTVVKVPLKYVPLSPEAGLALAIEERMEEGVTDVSDLMPDLPRLEEPAPAALTKSARLAGQLSPQGEAQAQAAPSPTPAGDGEGQTPPPTRRRGRRPPKEKAGPPETAPPAGEEAPVPLEAEKARALSQTAEALWSIAQAPPDGVSEAAFQAVIDQAIIDLDVPGRQVADMLAHIGGGRRMGPEWDQATYQRACRVLARMLDVLQTTGRRPLVEEAMAAEEAGG
jgi:recombination protein RecT